MNAIDWILILVVLYGVGYVLYYVGYAVLFIMAVCEDHKKGMQRKREVDALLKELGYKK